MAYIIPLGKYSISIYSNPLNPKEYMIDEILKPAKKALNINIKSEIGSPIIDIPKIQIIKIYKNTLKNEVIIFTSFHFFSSKNDMILLFISVKFSLSITKIKNSPNAKDNTASPIKIK